MKSLQVIIEKADDGFFGRIEVCKSYLPVTFGRSENEVIRNLKALIKDYQTHEKRR
jgi:predicted RNase H-like HicB family nuclease